MTNPALDPGDAVADPWRHWVSDPPFRRVLEPFASFVLPLYTVIEWRCADDPDELEPRVAAVARVAMPWSAMDMSDIWWRPVL